MTARKPQEREDVAGHLREPETTLDAADAAVAADEAHGPDLPNIPFIDASDATHVADATDVAAATHVADATDVAAATHIADAAVETKPTWRGWIHAGTFPLTIVAGIVLISLAEGAAAKWTSTVFTLTSMLLFGSSALYHRIDWRPRAKVVLKRIDHANIFLLIAGTYTPLAILALPPGKGILLLSLVWAGALVGIGFRVFWIGAPRWLYVPIYLALGWAAMMYVGDMLAANPAMMILVVVGGLMYTAGAIIYALKKPNPFPGTFGFHEIFHTLTVLAFLCHWTATLLIAIHPVYNVG